VDKQELQAALREENIREDTYDLNGGNMPESELRALLRAGVSPAKVQRLRGARVIAIYAS
jgi:hypothetical protein